MLFFSEELMLFQQFCSSVVNRYHQVQAFFASELQLSTRFPFHFQDRFLFGFKWGFENEVKKVSKKWFQRVPKWTPKVDQNRQKGCSGGVPKRDPSPGPGKVRSGCYLLHFSKVAGLKKDIFLGTILGPCGRQNR